MEDSEGLLFLCIRAAGNCSSVLFVIDILLLTPARALTAPKMQVE